MWGGLSFEWLPTAEELKDFPPPENWTGLLPDEDHGWFTGIGNDGILEWIFMNIGTTNKYYVEFGFNAATFEACQANVYNLYLTHNWTGLLLDVDNENPKINLWRHQLSADNIVSVFKQHNVLKEPDYLSVDVDSIDLWLLKAIFEGGYRPRVVTIEYNCNYPHDCTLTHQPTWSPYQGAMVYGVCLGAVDTLAQQFGYTLVHVVTFNDAFLVRNDLLKGAWIRPFVTFEHTGNHEHHVVTSWPNAALMIDYSTYLHTNGDVEKARLVGNAYTRAINNLYRKLFYE